MIAHQTAGESPCGWCRQAEIAARLTAEAVTWRPTSPAAVIPFGVNALEPVSAEQAAVNAAILAAELDVIESEPEHRPGPKRGHLHVA
jgi:hypothetical protein